jgi:exopolysaccharide production protein ExoZ
MVLLPIGFGLLVLSDVTSDARLLACGVPAVLLLVGALALEPWLSQRVWAPIRLIGDASYSIYLFHLLPIFGFSALFRLVPLTGWPQLMGWLLSSIALAILVGIAVHLLVERPLLRFARRTGMRPPPLAYVPAEGEARP